MSEGTIESGVSTIGGTWASSRGVSSPEQSNSCPVLPLGVEGKKQGHITTHSSGDFGYGMQATKSSTADTDRGDIEREDQEDCRTGSPQAY